MAEQDPVFYLAPASDLASQIINHDRNCSYKVPFQGQFVLRAGMERSSKKPGCLLTFGRDEGQGDIYLPTRSWSKLHCYFFLNPLTLRLILRDVSTTRDTHVSHWKKTPKDSKKYQLQGTPKQRVLLPEHDDIVIDIGKARFSLIWPVPKTLEGQRASENAKIVFAQKVMPAVLDWTDLDDRVLPKKAYETRSEHTPSLASQNKKHPKITHEQSRPLGKGSFGSVYETVDLYNGDVMAVKTVTHPPGNNNVKYAWKQEVETLSALVHVSLNSCRMSASVNIYIA